MLNEIDRITELEVALEAALANHEQRRAERDAALAELKAVRAVADPDNELPDASLRDCVMRLGKQAAMLPMVNKIANKRGKQRKAFAEMAAEACTIAKKHGATSRRIDEIKKLTLHPERLVVTEEES